MLQNVKKIVREKATEETKVEVVDELLKDGCSLEKALKIEKLDEETYN